MKEDYYNQNPVRRGYDFFLGFFGIITFFILLLYGLSFVKMYSLRIFINIILAVLAVVAAILIIRKTKRKYIGIGMLVPLGLFLIVFGGCFVLFTSLN